MVTVICGDAREALKALFDRSVHCIVTSPPYYGLRDYCVDGQIGLEQTPEAYVAELVSVFCEARRVLRDDGTLWLNLGDSYAGRGRSSYDADFKSVGRGGKFRPGNLKKNKGNSNRDGLGAVQDAKPKDLLMIPARVALALQADGWWLRSEIIWAKPNPMPEGIKDRPTNAHEKVFLLAKSARYYYDADAVKEPTVSDRPSGNGYKRDYRLTHTGRGQETPWTGVGGSRNLRNVWMITPMPFKGAHFAVFPSELVERCIKAGCPKGGMVLDPFGGSGTTGLVASSLGRDATLIELNPLYIEMTKERLGLFHV